MIAFPTDESQLRDYFAGVALAALIAKGKSWDVDLAESAYEYADEMLEARNAAAQEALDAIADGSTEESDEVDDTSYNNSSNLHAWFKTASEQIVYERVMNGLRKKGI